MKTKCINTLLPEALAPIEAWNGNVAPSWEVIILTYQPTSRPTIRRTWGRGNREVTLPIRFTLLLLQSRNHLDKAQ